MNMGADPEEFLHLTRHGDIAVIELDNAPVNALFGEMRDQIADMMAALDADPTVNVILFVAAGNAFCAGVDLKRTAVRSEPFFFHAALDAMDKVKKPIGAAIHGAALGGGLELSLACHYRLAGPRATFGLPEVEVGIIPGACGTQRLPRIIPLDKALGVAALGDILDVAQAQALGLIDATTNDPDFRAAALRWAATLRDKPLRITRNLPVKAPADIEPVFAAALARAEAEKPGEGAPLYAIKAVRAACELSFDEGVEVERTLVSERKYSAEAKSMRYLFFAERGAGKTDAKPATLDRINLIGSRADALIARAKAAGIAVTPDAPITLHVVDPHEPTPAGTFVTVMPPRRSGVVELAAPKGTDEAVLAALVKLLKGIGRATVIGRGDRIGQRLAAVGADNIPALAAEAEALVAEGVARSTAEVDLVAVSSLGLPRAEGGPCYIQSLG